MSKTIIQFLCNFLKAKLILVLWWNIITSIWCNILSLTKKCLRCTKDKAFFELKGEGYDIQVPLCRRQSISVAFCITFHDVPKLSFGLRGRKRQCLQNVATNTKGFCCLFKTLLPTYTYNYSWVKKPGKKPWDSKQASREEKKAINMENEAAARTRCWISL